MNDCSAYCSPLEKAWPEFPAGGGPAASTELANLHSPWCGSLVACPDSLSFLLFLLFLSPVLGSSLVTVACSQPQGSALSPPQSTEDIFKT